MLNHFRTLLVNVNDVGFSGDVGEELLPPGFRAVELPTALQSVRRVLFGSSPDRSMLDYRVKQLLAVVHSSELAEYVTSLDRRTTYDFSSEQLVVAGIFTPTVTPVRSAPGDNLRVLGAPSAPDATGKCRYDFVVRVVDTDSGRIEQASPEVQNTLFDFVPGDRIAFPGSGYSFRLTTNTVGQAWNVAIRLRPQKTLPTLVTELASIGEPALIQLFGIADDEPFKTFRNCWMQHPETPMKLAGLICALVYRTEERRLQGG